MKESIKQQKLLKSIVYWTLPPGIKNTFRELSIVRGYMAMKPILQKNLDLKDKHHGKRCFILCTGPSIKSQDLSLLKNEICFACSRFYLHEQIEIIKPIYYVQPSWHEPISIEAYKSTIHKAYERMPWSTAILGENAFSILNDSSLFNGNIYYYYGGYYGGGVHKDYLKIDLTAKTLKILSVSTQAIATAIYMGFKKIYLLGCDHDYIINWGKSQHFYDESISQYSEDWSGGLLQEFENHVDLWRTYLALKNIGTLTDAKIINLTPGSLLDVFERKELAHILQG